MRGWGRSGGWAATALSTAWASARAAARACWAGAGDAGGPHAFTVVDAEVEVLLDLAHVRWVWASCRGRSGDRGRSMGGRPTHLVDRLVGLLAPNRGDVAVLALARVVVQVLDVGGGVRRDVHVGVPACRFRRVRQRRSAWVAAGRRRTIGASSGALSGAQMETTDATLRTIRVEVTASFAELLRAEVN